MIMKNKKITIIDETDPDFQERERDSEVKKSIKTK